MSRCDCFICERGEQVGQSLVLADGFPVAPGHMLAAPRRHVERLSELQTWEWTDVMRAALLLGLEHDAVNIGINAGRDAGQTVAHLHVHVIPRRPGDVEDPRGGVRGVIPERRIYEGEK